MTAGHASEGTHVVFNLLGLEVTSVVTTMWVVMAAIALLSFLGTRRLDRVPGRLQNFLEWGVESLSGVYSAVLGKEKTRKFLPFLMTLFVFILFSNYSGLLPGAGHLPGLQAPTSALAVPAGLATVVFFTTHIVGVRENGLGYFKRFFKPYFFFLPINLIEEFVRPLSLTLRLYGNIYGEETTIAVLASLVPLVVPIPMMLLSVLMGAIQALVFTMLTAVYIGNAAGHGH